MSTCQHQYESDARGVLMDNRDKPRCTIRTCNGPRSQHRLRRSSDLIRKRYQRGRSCRHRRLPWRHLLTKLRHPEIFLTANNGQIMQAQANYANGVAVGDTFFASAGDTGATFGTNTAMANFPGSDLHNTGVTGTQGLPYNATGTLTPCPTSTPFSCTSGLSSYHGPCVLGRTVPPNCIPDGYGGEQVWNEPSFGAATGGAPSIIFGVQSYQTGLGLSARGPDADYNGAIDGGVLVVYGGLGSPVLFIVGGTSAGSPQWAGIIALANQARASLGKGPIGDLNPVLYGIYHSARYATDFHDITVGNDQLVGSSVGFSAGTGYDVASGIGSPIVGQLIVDLAAA